MIFNLNKMINNNEKKDEKKDEKKETLKRILSKFVDDNYKDLEETKNNYIGSGAFGLVAEIKYKVDPSKNYVAKVLETIKDYPNESDLILEFRGPNIVKVNKVYHKKYENKDYDLILMEKASLKDLNSFVRNLKQKNSLELIFQNPFEIVGDNIIRLIVKQLMKGFETFYLGNYTHFDFKPENALIFNNLTVKLSDFGFLRNIEKIKDENNKIKVPGFTPGYIPPEYYYNDNHLISVEEAKKIDFFALGATIYFLKYGEIMINYPKYKDGIQYADYMIKLIERGIDRIKSTKSSGKDFNEFLINLIQYKSKNRSSFEEIYRNKWLNKNWKKILEIKENNINDNQMIIIELDKSEFLFEKNKHINEQRKQIGIFNANKYKDKKICYHKFKFKL